MRTNAKSSSSVPTKQQQPSGHKKVESAPPAPAPAPVNNFRPDSAMGAMERALLKSNAGGPSPFTTRALNSVVNSSSATGIGPVKPLPDPYNPPNRNLNDMLTSIPQKPDLPSTIIRDKIDPRIQVLTVPKVNRKPFVRKTPPAGVTPVQVDYEDPKNYLKSTEEEDKLLDQVEEDLEYKRTTKRKIDFGVPTPPKRLTNAAKPPTPEPAEKVVVPCTPPTDDESSVMGVTDMDGVETQFLIQDFKDRDYKLKFNDDDADGKNDFDIDELVSTATAFINWSEDTKQACHSIGGFSQQLLETLHKNYQTTESKIAREESKVDRCIACVEGLVGRLKEQKLEFKAMRLDNQREFRENKLYLKKIMSLCKEQEQEINEGQKRKKFDIMVKRYQQSKK